MARFWSSSHDHSARVAMIEDRSPSTWARQRAREAETEESEAARLQAGLVRAKALEESEAAGLQAGLVQAKALMAEGHARNTRCEYAAARESFR